MGKLKIEKSLKKKGLILAVITDRFEAKQVVDLARSENTIILCLSLEAELYLGRALGSYNNPVYDFAVGKNTIAAYGYSSINFDIAYSYSGGEYYQFIRDRYAYFLTELDRSLDLANKIIEKYKPSKMIIGEPVDYLGSSVLDGNLKRDAFFLLAKRYKIPYKLLKSREERRTAIQIVGRMIHFIRSLKKQSVLRRSDLLIVATPRHVIYMAPLIKQISNFISVTVITYTLSLAVKRRLDRVGIKYFEKEKLLDNQIKKVSKSKKAEILKQRPWNSFVLPKYSKNVQVTNFIRDKLRRIFVDETQDIIEDYSSAQQVISKVSPKMLLTTTDPDTKALTYINAAKKAGIMTMCIQHGIFFPIDPPASTPQSKYFVTWSNLSLTSLKNNPHFKKKIILIGHSPFHDTPERISHQKKRAGLKKILFLAVTDIIDSTIKSYYLEKLFRELDKYGNDFEILIRTHPFQNRRNLEALANYGKIKIVFDKNVNLSDSIAASDLVIFENTTAGLDAMLNGIPSVYFNPYSGQDFFQVSDTNAALTIFSEKDVNEKLGRFLNNPSQWADYSKRGKKFAKRYLGLDATSKRNQLVKIILEKVGTNR